ncbi:hypothetical protein AAZX31_03G222900 [Glycine max]|uniref:Uncharacterized protein n=2 Tax=Glycine subgen. Soja TaxID=1462606 RepID=K7KGT0_SOYBN|nr:hypothetical protein JHK86_008419 [Glycine max]KAH1071612.1 hypothetical protein GYH30_008240 [Glycine max]KRH68652.1 hypothetical protein GLYMA_03G243300v4 [Glycine max]RZC22292.1 hypothetical protein D0Y65_008113 [Glycine soja]
MGPGGPAQEALLVGVHQAQDFSVVFAISLALCICLNFLCCCWLLQDCFGGTWSSWGPIRPTWASMSS